MAATAKFQAWTNATWAWDSAAAGAPCVELEAELDAWIAAINANPSQSGKQVVKIRGAASSTTANYRGIGVQLPAQNTTGDLYVRFYSSTTSVINFFANTGFTDDTSNGGYGTGTGTTGGDSSIAWKNTVTTEGSFIIGYSTVDGQEFFHLGWVIDNLTTTSDGWTITKDQNGEWMAFVNDGGSASGLMYDDLQATPGWVNAQGYEGYASSSVAGRLTVYRNTTGLTSGDTIRYLYTAASPDIMEYGTSSVQGSYVAIAGSSDQLVRTGYYGVFIRYTPV